MTRRLLILKCSARKRGGFEPLAAIERYDGPLWRVLRNWREQTSQAANLDVYVLSAAFGLIPATQPIPRYDRTMDPARAAELWPEVHQRFAELMQQHYTHLCLALSQRYLRAMQGWEQLVPLPVVITQTDGTMGVKLAQLRAWLDGQNWVPGVVAADRLVAAEQPRGTAVICGVTLRLTREEVLDRARQMLEQDRQGAQRYRGWYVLVDGQPVSTKWLVSLMSGVPTSRFDASSARRVLLALGVDIERVPRH